MAVVVFERESVDPGLFVEVHQHFLFQLVFPVVDGDGVVVSVQTVD